MLEEYIISSVLSRHSKNLKQHTCVSAQLQLSLFIIIFFFAGRFLTTGLSGKPRVSSFFFFFFYL